MAESIINILFTSPLPVALVILGVLCVVFAIIGGLPSQRIEGHRAYGLGVFGGVLIVLAIVSAGVLAASSTNPPVTSLPSVQAADQLCDKVEGTELLPKPWHLEGKNSDDELYQDIDPNVLIGKNSLLITYDLHGLTVHEGERKDESAIIFDQPNWHVISLANYGENGKDGEQTIRVPLEDFIGLLDTQEGMAGGTPLDLFQPVTSLHIRIWSSKHFIVDIKSICAFRDN